MILIVYFFIYFKHNYTKHIDTYLQKVLLIRKVIDLFTQNKYIYKYK